MRIHIKNKLTITVLIACILMAFTSSCYESLKKTAKKNYAYMYNPTTTSLHPNFNIYHQNDSSSVLLIKFYPGELLFNQANERIVYQAQIQFQYKLYNLKTKLLDDSSSFSLTLDLDEVKEEMVTFIPVKAKFGNEYMLQAVTQDLKRRTQHREAIRVDKTNRFNNQNFLFRIYGSNAPVFNARIDSTNFFKVEYSYGRVDSFIVKYFKNNFYYPVVPSMDITVRDYFESPDSQMVHNLKDASVFKLNKEGLYIFQIAPGNETGAGISCFDADFPYLKKSDDLARGLKYLLTDKEFNEIMVATNKKLKIDEFWLKAADNNIDVARDLIRIYYNRAYLANVYFTSYKEGWKTDRGMVYLVYGLPDIIYRSDNSERWVYQNSRTDEEISFIFTQEIHPYSNNHYVLSRGETVQTRWSDAISSWRKGKPFSLE